MVNRNSLFLVLAVAVAACTGDREKEAAGPSPDAPSAEAAAPAPAPAVPPGDAASDALDPADFTTSITNPFFPLSSVRTTEFAGTSHDTGGEIAKTWTVKRRLERTDTVAGITVVILEVKEYQDGELVEYSEDYFAQHRDGSVWSFGERVRDYEDGRVVGRDGQWVAGEGKTKPGLYMPASPAVGQEFEQVRASGVAADRSKVVQLDVEVTVPAGKFTGCMKTEDVAPLDRMTDFKFYCPWVGLVREESANGFGSTELVHFA
jgi:hypothetical protein